MRLNLAFVSALASLLFMVAALLRPCIIGALYAIFSLLCARGTWFQSRPLVWMFLTLFSSFVCGAQIALFVYQLISADVETSEECVRNMSINWLRLSTVGFYRLAPLSATWQLRELGSDVIAAVSSMICFCFASNIYRRESQRRATSDEKGKRHIYGTIFRLFLLCMTSITDPSFFNLPYFVAFLIALTVSCFAGPNVISVDSITRIKRIASYFTAFHLFATYIFQLPITKSNISSMITDTLGITNFFDSKCDHHLSAIVGGTAWTKYASVMLLFALHTELCRSVRQAQKIKRRRRTAVEEEIELQNRVIEVEEESPAGDRHDSIVLVDPVLCMGILETIGGCMAKFLKSIKNCFPLISKCFILTLSPLKKLLKKLLKFFYVSVPTAIMCWAILFPSWPSLAWMIMMLLALPFAGTPRRRSLIFLFLAVVSLILLTLQYCSSLKISTEWSIDLYRMGFGIYTDETAFRMLFCKTFLAMPLFLTRAVDRRLKRSKKRYDPVIDGATDHESTPTEPLTRSRRTSTAQLSQASHRSAQLIELVNSGQQKLIVVRQKIATMWEVGVPLVAFCVCSAYVIGRYLISILNEQSAPWVDNHQWISTQSRALFAAIWMPSAFLLFLAIAFLQRISMTVCSKRITTSSSTAQVQPLQNDNLNKNNVFFEVAVRFSKRHFWKVVAFSLAFLAAKEVAAIFLLLMFIVLLMIIIPASRSICSLVAMILLGSVWVARFLLSQLGVGLLQADLMAWIGLQSVDDNERIVLTMSLICVESYVNHKKKDNSCQPFKNVTYLTADNDWKTCGKFLFKYFFYKFGLEASLIWSVCFATYRQDVVGMIYLIAVFIIALCPRAALRGRRAIILQIYGSILALIFLIEYLLRLQLPPGAIQQYPWDGWRERTLSWLFLDSKLKKLTADVLVMFGDLVQLMLVWSQESVFRNKPSAKGGDNVPLSEKSDGISAFPPECIDYISEKSDLLSYMKRIFFLISHWATLIIILISATFDNTFFALIYTFGTFLFLWQGTRLYAHNSLPQFLRKWNNLLIYTLTVLFLKSIYIGLSSLFITTFDRSVRLQTLRELEYKNNPTEPAINETDTDSACTIVTDVIIFASLICQIRILNSWYFQQVVVDYRADRVLKSSGTERINKMKSSEDKDNKTRVVQHLDRLMEQLDHEDELCVNEESNVREYSHLQIKRSGSYHHVKEESLPQVLKSSSRAALFHNYQPWWQPSEWFFNESISHAYVAHRHDEEKRELKRGHRDKLLLERSKEGLENLRKEFCETANEHGLFVSSMSTSSEANAQIGHEELKRACEHWSKKHIIVCIYYSIMAHTKMLCFVCLIAAHALRPALITLPLPLFVFFWGTLSIPRPPKHFFITCIVYVGVIIQVSLIVQIIDRICNLTSDIKDAIKCPVAIKTGFDIFGLLEPPTIVNNLWEIILLAVLLLHRYKMFRLGLWNRYKGNSGILTRIKKWIRAMRKEKEPATHDWYTFMVICDFLFIIVLVLFYSFIGEGGSGDLFSDVRYSILPRWLILSVLVLLSMMLVDRITYLRKKTQLRLLYYVALSIGFHALFMVFIFDRKDSENVSVIPAILYSIKCVYLLMYSWHIRHGYPSISSVDILDKKFWPVRLVLMKIYLFIPLLVEVRAAMDFGLTRTSLSFSDWRRMENYHNEAAVQNCWIRLDNFLDKKFPTKSDDPTSKCSRSWGWIFLVIFLLIIGSPLLFAYLKFVGTRMSPEKMVLSVRLQGYPALYYMEAQHRNLRHLYENEQMELTRKFSNYRYTRERQAAAAFLNEYDEKQDIFRVLFPPNSQTEWSLSQPGIIQLLSELSDTSAGNQFKAQVKFELYRSLIDESNPHVWSNTINLSERERAAFYDMIMSRSATPVNLQFGLPPYIIAPSEGKLREAHQLMAPLSSTNDSDITFELKLMSGSSQLSTYWQLTMKEQHSNFTLKPPPEGDSRRVQLVVFVDKVFPESVRNIFKWLGIGQIGMIGLMTFVWLVIGLKVFRPCFDTKISNAALENLPNVDKILHLIRDIYLAREKKKWYLEKRLFQKLVFLFRSPETMIKWSRYTIKAKKL